ncbi:endonuclease/exonuclease/phosphatase family protein [Vibrio hepatarius]|uniref:endonuclease/exonuclease/phosphatase family protein n=1 Tax=Vibrio hepatarius TaxID=171383 RepID=UPI001C083FE1|nr:hypothetical protein [Vibrio hepatarius]MBU2895418.1 hypothetical protein [Vibrio hepatarius]
MKANIQTCNLINDRIEDNTRQSVQLSKSVVKVFNCCVANQASNPSEYYNNANDISLDRTKPAKTIQVFTHNNANREMSKSMCDSIVKDSTSDIVFISTEEMKNLSGAIKEYIERSQYVIVFNSAQKMVTVTKPKELLFLICNPSSTAQITLVKKGITAPIVMDYFNYRDVLNNPNKGGTITIQKIGDMKVAMVNIHLDSRDKDERKKEINDLLCKIITKHPDVDHIVLSGDFNTRNRKLKGHLVRALQDVKSFRSELGVPDQYEIKLPIISQYENTYKWEADVNARAKKGSKRQENDEMQSGYLDGVVILTPKNKADTNNYSTMILPEGKSSIGSSFGSDHRSVTVRLNIDRQ